MVLIFIIIVALILIFFLFPFIIIRLKISNKNIKVFSDYINQKFDYSPFSLSQKDTFNKSFVFAPHPYTNWSLNPHYRNASNQKEHTIEGFKKTSKDDSIMNVLKNNPKEKKKEINRLLLNNKNCCHFQLNAKCNILFF